MTLLLQTVIVPWWGRLIFFLLFVASGTINLIQLWKSGKAKRWEDAAKSAESARESAEAERNILREARDRLNQQVIDLTAENKVLQARTDLDGLRAQVIGELSKIREEFTKHSEHDLATATQQTAALEAVKTSLDVLLKQK